MPLGKVPGEGGLPAGHPAPLCSALLEGRESMWGSEPSFSVYRVSQCVLRKTSRLLLLSCVTFLYTGLLLWHKNKSHFKQSCFGNLLLLVSVLYYILKDSLYIGILVVERIR